MEEEINKIKNSSDLWIEKKRKFKELIKNLKVSEKISFYELFLDFLSPQGTEQWLKERKVGGSSAYKILKEPLTVAKQILNITKFKKVIDMEWGNIMEVVAVKFLSKYIKISTFGAIPGFADEKDNIYTTFSPDGIFEWTESSTKLNDFLNIEYEKLIGKVCLLEIKCPYRRKEAGLPECYIPQIQLGLVSTISEICLYLEFFIKKCSIKDFNFSWKTTPVFSKFEQKNDPILIGFVGFYGEKPEFCKKMENPIKIENHENYENLDINKLFYLNELIEENFSYTSNDLRAYYLISLFPKEREKILKYYRVIIPNCDLIDFGSTNNFYYDYKDPENLSYKVYYSETIDFRKPYDCLEFFEKELDLFKKKHENAFGIMCYKLFSINAFIEEKKNYNEEIIKILTFCQKLNQIKEQPESSWLNLIKESF